MSNVGHSGPICRASPVGLAAVKLFLVLSSAAISLEAESTPANTVKPDRSGSHCESIPNGVKAQQSGAIRTRPPASGLLYRPGGNAIGRFEVGDCLVVLERRPVRQGPTSYVWLKVVRPDEQNDPRLFGWVASQDLEGVPNQVTNQGRTETKSR